MFFAHRDVQFVIRIYFVFDDRYFGSFHYTAHEQDAGNHQAYFDGDSQVEDDGEEKVISSTVTSDLGFFSNALKVRHSLML